METLSEFDIALAQRLNVITPNVLAHASSDFVEYWQRVTQEAQRRTNQPDENKGVLYESKA
jgi:hypothetical protein